MCLIIFPLPDPVFWDVTIYTALIVMLQSRAEDAALFCCHLE